MLVLKDLEDQRELMQNDISCILDGVEDEGWLLIHIDSVIVDRMQILIDKLKESPHA
jgi:hypothetical protein